MKKTLASLTLLATIGSGYVQAEQPSFNYVEGGYTSIDDFDGFLVRGSYEFIDNIYLSGSYSALNDELSDLGIETDTDLDIATIGLGVIIPVSDTASFYLEAEYLDFENSSSSNIGPDVDESEDGYELSMGVRAMLTSSTEIYSELSHKDVLAASTEITFGGRQYLTDNLGLFAEYQRDDFETDTYNLGVTYKF